MIGKFSIAAAAVVLSGGLAAATAAQADITIQQRISVEGNGIMSAGNMSGTTTTMISGDRSRKDDDMQMKSGFMRMLAHSAVGPTAQIVRLDEDKIIHLDLNKKQYTETTFEAMRAQLQKATAQATQGTDNGKAAAPAPIDESQCEWLEPTADVKKTGQTASIAGFSAEEVTITASQPCKDKKTGSICEIALSLDEWLAPKFSSGDEALKFERAYAQKMGFDARSGQDVSARAQALFSRYKGVWTQIASKMKDAKGYPVKSAFTFAIGGEQCQGAQSAQQAKSGGDDGSSSSASSSSGGLGQLGSSLAGALFHRKKADDESSQKTPPPPVPAGTVPLMTITSELLSVSAEPVNSDRFEVPVDFKKVEH